MRNLRNFCGAICLVLILVSLSACGMSNAEREQKREEDRVAIHLTEAQRQRDQYKAQLEEAQSALAQAQAKANLAQQNLEAARAQARQAEEARLKAVAQQQAAQARAEKAVSAADLAQKQIRVLDEQIATLKSQLASRQPSSTAPTTESNK